MLRSMCGISRQVACDALDWRTAFGIFLWYGQSDEDFGKITPWDSVPSMVSF